MTDGPLSVAKYGAMISLPHPVPPPNLDRFNAVAAAIDRILDATPEQRAVWAAEAKVRESSAAVDRATVRESTAAVPLTLDILLGKLGAEFGWDAAYAEHLVQPYCGCGPDIDGWSYCEHARDLGLA